ncbi:hypothetical protein D9M68_841100 [compost metagenome]
MVGGGVSRREIDETHLPDAPGNHRERQEAWAQVLWFDQHPARDEAARDDGVLCALGQDADAACTQAAAQGPVQAVGCGECVEHPTEAARIFSTQFDLVDREAR